MRISKVLVIAFAICLILSFSCFAEGEPVIIQQPTNFYFSADTELPATASFSVLASGSNLTYQWQTKLASASSWSNLSNTGDYSGATTSVLNAIIRTTSIEGKRLFRCVISSDAGSVTTDAVTTTVGAYFLGSFKQMLNWSTDVITSIFSWVIESCSCIISEPILLIGVGFFALGAAIGILSRLLSRS